VIDNKTENKGYPLPHPENIASQDVGRIATAIEMIDVDVNACSVALDEIHGTVGELDAKSLRIPSSLVGTVNTELSDLEPRRYVVVNDDATGFSTVEGGGGEGGLTGEILAKRSNANFDTMWIDPRAVLKKTFFVKSVDSTCVLQNNSVIILVDENEIDNSDQLPRVGLTQRQILSDVIVDSQYTYILCDVIDETVPDESDIATATKFGRVMIGPGIGYDNGKIFIPTPVKASTKVFGIVKIGPGLDVEDGVVSAPNYQHADHENYGTVKLGADFKTGNSGELLLANKKQVEEIIYQFSNVDIVQNNCIVPKSNFAKYRLFINEDSMITFDWSQIVIEKDLAFDLEIISDGIYVISFDANVVWTLPCAGVSVGKTIIHFERKVGADFLSGELKETGTIVSGDLTPSDGDDIQPDFICGSTGIRLGNGGALAPSQAFTKRTGDWTYSYGLFTSATDEGLFSMDFMRSTLIESIYHGDNFWPSLLYVEGSIDKKNWTTLYFSQNVTSVDGHIYLTKRGFFRHYRIRCSKDRFRWFHFWGYAVDDEISELIRVVPLMNDSDTLNGFSITSSGKSGGELYNITQNNSGSYAHFNTRLDGEYWIKYELPEAAVVDLLDLGAPNEYPECMPRWFKIEASNDDESWVLLLERGSLTNWNQGETKQYHIANDVAYKFFKFTPIEIPSAEFRIARFRLYRRVEGHDILIKFIPNLSGPSQGGYEVTASSQANAGNVPYYAFDGDADTKWTSWDNSSYDRWIQIKFPTETICNAVLLRSEAGNYGYTASSFEIQGSNDGENYTSLKVVTGASWVSAEEKIIQFFNDIAFLYYRVWVNATQSGGGYASFSEVNFGTVMREYKREISVKEYLLPIMSSNSQDGYEVSCNSEYNSSEGIVKAFDRDTGTIWSTNNDSPTATILITLPTAKICDLISIYPRSSYLNRAYGAFTLYGSSDGDNWTELLAVSDISAWSANVEKSWEVESGLAFLRYKLVGTPRDGGNVVTVTNINLLYKYTTKEY
jgi:hypothetical protein